MKHLSLTARMSLMFMSAVIAVLTVAGLSFNMLSQHHFKMLDRQALVEKLESAKHILNNARGEASLSEELPQLRALLGAHQDLAATILASDGSVLFSDPRAVEVPERFRRANEQSMWEWQNGQHMYRGMTEQISVADQAEPLTALLILDVTDHTHFSTRCNDGFGLDWSSAPCSVPHSAGWLLAAALGLCGKSLMWPPGCPLARYRSESLSNQCRGNFSNWFSPSMRCWLG